ncbi:MAG TPA: DUF2513 domain-containing protein [Woeseiaceae bacterium]|nr:DUF2513 domain-containing protein [Woeseiaceae bacterium]
MKRDMELCRAIMLHLETCEDTMAPQRITVGDFTPEQVSYHVKLLADAGLIEALDFSSMDSFHWDPIRLTWEGHEFLDAARDDSVWNKVMREAGEVPITVLKELLVQGVRVAVGL